MSRRTWGAIIAAAAIAGTTATASAGLKSYTSGHVYTSGTWVNVYGALGDTRNTPNGVEYMECGTNATTGYCLYRDPSSTYYSCTTSDAGMIAVIRSMSGDGSINFTYDSSTGLCGYVLSYASSRAQPKAP